MLNLGWKFTSEKLVVNISLFFSERQKFYRWRGMSNMNGHNWNWRVKYGVKVRSKEMNLGGHLDVSEFDLKPEIVFVRKFKIRPSHENELWNDSWVT